MILRGLIVVLLTAWCIVFVHLRKDVFRIRSSRPTMTRSELIRPVTPKRQSTAPRRWKPGHDVRYDAVASLVQNFDAKQIDTFLIAGSALGAHRNHGWFHWDKDADIMILTTDSDIVEGTLKALNFSYRENVDGVGPGDHGFGYHVYLPNTKKYIDLWLFNRNTSLECAGVDGGCKRWCNKYKASAMCKPHAKHWFYPARFVPYGPYLMPCATEEYLNFYYTPTWRTKCGGWTRGKQMCSRFYDTTDFVFHDVDENGHALEILKQGSVVKHVFAVVNGTYTLKSLL